MAREFNPRFTVRSRKLPQWQAAEAAGSPATPSTPKTTIRLDELIAEQRAQADPDAVTVGSPADG